MSDLEEAWNDEQFWIYAEREEERMGLIDLVSKADVLETYAELYDVFDDYKGIKNELHKVYDKLNALPSAQPEQRWIPCSERLPEEDVKVLISYRYKEGEGDTSHVDVDITSYGQMYFGGRAVAGVKHWRQPFEYFSSNYEVIAWMPLPEPWKGEEE